MDWNRVQNQSSQGDSFTGGVLRGAWDGAKGLASDVADLAKAGYKVATDDAYRDHAMAKAAEIAQATRQFGAKAARDPIGTGELTWNQAKAAAGQARQAFVEARAAAEREGRLNNFYGNVVGRGGFEVGSMFVPVAKLGLIGKGAKGASGVAKTTSVTRKAGQAERLGKNAGKLKAGARRSWGTRRIARQRPQRRPCRRRSTCRSSPTGTASRATISRIPGTWTTTCRARTSASR